MDRQFSSVTILRDTIRKKNEQLKRDYEIDKSGKYVVRGTIILKRGGVFNDIVAIILYNTVSSMLTSNLNAATPFIIIG